MPRLNAFLPALVPLLAAFPIFAGDQASDLARRRPGAQTRWSSFENPSAAKGAAAKENRGAKGHAFDSIEPGQTRTLLDVRGAGEIRRIWLTVRDRDPQMLRSLRLEMYWDGKATPAVSVPLGDFFGAILGRPVAFENELFSNPEGRSFNCYVPMPFRTAARITLTNDSTRAVPFLFYDVDLILLDKPDPDSLYFHAIFRREKLTQLGRDFELLPKIHGEGHFLGVHAGIITHPDMKGWWGEGEVKMYVDGDSDFPTISGTGTEDYIGTGWGQATFAHRFQGSLVSDSSRGQYGFYRYHVPDPVYFHKDIRVTIQQMGGGTKEQMAELQHKGIAIRPVSAEHQGRFVKLAEDPAVTVDLDKLDLPKDAWVNVQRRDDWSAVALFYLDAPENGLPRIQAISDRVFSLGAEEIKLR